MNQQLTIFAIYASEDKEDLVKVLEYLKPFAECESLIIWDDDPIQKGKQWKPSSPNRLEQANLFLLLLSNTFMHSEFVQQLEFKTIIDQYKADRASVLPVILETCPWDIDFEADEYTFNFKRLTVLPSNGKPVKDWSSSKNAYKNIAEGIAVAAGLSLFDNAPKATEKSTERKVISNKVEELTEVSFYAKKEIEIPQIISQKDEVKEINQAQKLQKEIENQNTAEEDKSLKKQQETKLQKEAEAKRIEEHQKAEKLAQQQRLQQEELERQKERERKIEEKKQKVAAKTNQEIQEMEQEIGSRVNKRLLVVAIIITLAIFGIWTFNRSTDDQLELEPQDDIVEIENSVVSKEKEELEEIEEVKEKPLKKFKVGELYEGGIVCSFDSEKGIGVLVQMDDSGLMTWQNAMQIHEKLGKGWRLPTFEELVQLRNTVGQGAGNIAEFSDGLYWSATDYDAYQARLLRFRDGNTSYHYNKVAEHRKFQVRAIRNFSR